MLPHLTKRRETLGHPGLTYARSFFTLVEQLSTYVKEASRSLAC